MLTARVTITTITHRVASSTKTRSICTTPIEAVKVDGTTTPTRTTTARELASETRTKDQDIDLIQ